MQDINIRNKQLNKMCLLGSINIISFNLKLSLKGTSFAMVLGCSPDVLPVSGTGMKYGLGL